VIGTALHSDLHSGFWSLFSGAVGFGIGLEAAIVH
jgi:hypothetical protein